MAGDIIQKAIIDGAGNTFFVDFWNTSGNTTGPYAAIHGLYDPTSNNIINPATANNQVPPITQGANTPGQVGTLIFGAVSNVAVTYSSNTSNPLTMTTTGLLRIDGSNVTQPVSGNFWQTTQPVSGTFWQTTQPVSMTAIPALSTGANTIGAVTQASGPWTFNLTQIAGAAVATGHGTASGSLRVELPTDGTGQVSALQSGTWNVTNISGTISLPTGAATAALQPTNVTQASVTSGQTGHLLMAAATTSAPSYNSAQTYPLSMSTSGALRIDGSATTQPVSGTFWQNTQNVSVITISAGLSTGANTIGAVTQASGPWSFNFTQLNGNTVAVAANGIIKVGLADGSGNALASNNNALNVNIISGNVGGGSNSFSIVDSSVWTVNSSSFVPHGGVFNDSAVALASGQQGTRRLTSQRAGHINIRDSSGNELGLTSAPIQVSLANTGNNTTSLNVSLALLPGLGSSANTIGAVTQASGPWTFNFTQVNGNTVATGHGTANAALRVELASDSTGQVSAIQSGAWNITNISGIVSLPTGAATAALQPTNAPQASVTSGQTGHLIQGATTTSAPAYNTAQTNPISLTTAGYVRVDTGFVSSAGDGIVTGGLIGTQAVANGGSTYVSGDVGKTVSLVGGTSTTTATVTIATVVANVVTSVTVTNAGVYSVAPTNAVATTGGGTTGTGLTLNATFAPIAQALFSGVTPVNGWKVNNPNISNNLWVNDNSTTPAVNDGFCVFGGGGQYATEPGEKPVGPVYLLGITIGDKFKARKW